VDFKRIVDSGHKSSTDLDNKLFQRYQGKRFSEFLQPFSEEKTTRGYKRYFTNSLKPEDLYEGKISDMEYLNLSMNSTCYSLVKGSSRDFTLPPEYTSFSSLIVLRSATFSHSIIIDAGSVEMRNKIVNCTAPICIRQLPQSLTTPVTCGQANCVDIKNLMKKAKPSFFGKGDEKVYDESVRKGLELLPHQLHLDISNLSPMLVQIKKTLFPEALEIRLKFAKVAFYSAGGHFDVHRDTVHSKYHQGTVLVEIVSFHKGGDLVLEANGVTHRWSLEGRKSQYKDEVLDSSNSREGSEKTDVMVEREEEVGEKEEEEESCDENISRVKYIAFYTDTSHSVEAVTAGVRAVLQFDVYALYKDTEEDSSSLDDVPESSDVQLSITQDDVEEFDQEQEEERYRDRDFSKSFFQSTQVYDSSQVTDKFISELVLLLSEQVTDDRAIAFPLLHMYTDTQVLIQTLKEGDRQIFQGCLQSGYCVQLVPIIIEATSNYEGSFKTEGKYSISAIPSVLTEADIGFVLSDEDNTSVISVNMVAPSRRLKSGKFYPAVTYAVTGFEQIEILDSKPYRQWVGNEPAPAHHKYFSVACVVTTKNAVQTSDDKDESEHEEDGEEDDEEDDDGEEAEIGEEMNGTNEDDVNDTSDDIPPPTKISRLK